jgi:hypothetical protein
MAETETGAALLLADVKWMHAGCLQVRDSFLLFLTIARFPAIRAQLMETDAFPGFFAWVAEDGGRAELAAICPVLRRFDPPPAVIRALDAAGFFKAFIPKFVASDAPQAAEGVILLIDRLCRKGWTNGFVFFVRELPALFGRGGAVTQKALVASLALAALPQARALFLEVDVIGTLRSARVEPEYENYREKFLKYLGDP